MTKTKTTATFKVGRGDPFTLILSPGSGEEVTIGDETITCAVKKAVNSDVVPSADTPEIFRLTPRFVPIDGETAAYWAFDASAEQCALLVEDYYVADFLIRYASADEDRTRAVALQMQGVVTNRNPT